MKPPVMEISPHPCYFYSLLEFKYFPQYPVLKTHSIDVLPLGLNIHKAVPASTVMCSVMFVGSLENQPAKLVQQIYK